MVYIVHYTIYMYSLRCACFTVCTMLVVREANVRSGYRCLIAWWPFCFQQIVAVTIKLSEKITPKIDSSKRQRSSNKSGKTGNVRERNTPLYSNDPLFRPLNNKTVPLLKPLNNKTGPLLRPSYFEPKTTNFNVFCHNLEDQFQIKTKFRRNCVNLKSCNPVFPKRRNVSMLSQQRL